MMRWLVNSSIQFRFLVLTVAVILMTFGITRLRDDRSQIDDATFARFRHHRQNLLCQQKYAC